MTALFSDAVQVRPKRKKRGPSREGRCGVSALKNVPVYRYGWRNNEKRSTLYGRMCRVVCRGRMNSALVEFIDNGQREVISRNALMKVSYDHDLTLRPRQREAGRE